MKLEPGSYRIVPGEHYGTPKELWGFDLVARVGPVAAARQFVRANAELFGLDGAAPRLERRAVVRSLGASHVMLQQRHRNVRVHRGFVSVHVANDGRVFLVKNRAVPLRLLGEEPDFRLSRERAMRLALDATGATRREAVVPKSKIERRWFPKGKRLRPAWRIRVRTLSPPQDFIVYIDADDGRLLSLWDNLAWADGVARVFVPSPVIALGDHRPLVRGRRVLPPPAGTYRTVALRDLRPGSLLDGKRVTTCRTPVRARSSERRWLFSHTEPGLAEAMAYHHVDRALRYLESLGFAGSRRIFKKPLEVNAHATEDDDSWYDPWLKALHFGAGRVPDAEDGETIVHELGHAIQDAICPDFGQSDEAAAMGEGFGDYFAASFFSRQKRGDYRVSVMCWDGIVFRRYDPPCVRRVDGTLDCTRFRAARGEHSNGRIWSAILWDIFLALGRKTADTIILESHFQLDGFTRFDRAARAIVDADENLYEGRHRAKLENIFHERRVPGFR